MFLYIVCGGGCEYNDVHFGRCDYSVSKSSNSAFFNDRNYKRASNNSAHMKTEHSIGTVHCK